MKSEVLEILNPENIKIDDRKIEDLIIFTLDLSKKINFFNFKNKKDGYWNNLIELDDTFLIVYDFAYCYAPPHKMGFDIFLLIV